MIDDSRKLNKVQNAEVSDTTGDEGCYKCPAKKIKHNNSSYNFFFFSSFFEKPEIKFFVE